jgi:hypothetical protein
MNYREMNYYNIDIGRVTLTVKEQDMERVQALLGDLAFGKRFYGGWIDNENPSPSPIGFYVVFKDQAMYADFHNLPYYYYNFHTRESYWVEYHQIIISHVTKHPAFRAWRGQWSQFDPSLLPVIVILLNRLASSPFFSHFHSVIVSNSGDIAMQGDENGT